MPNLLLAESGSTKTDWRLLLPDTPAQTFRTEGINPYLQNSSEIKAMLTDQLPWEKGMQEIDQIIFYGAGAASTDNQNIVKQALQSYFRQEHVAVHSDMMAAAHALCGDDSGVVCIIGTGSNSCYYDGKRAVSQQASLGYIAGDEGSGNYMGKRVLQYYAYKTFDAELQSFFEMEFGNDLDHILHNIYREPFPNRYLASFVKLLSKNRGHYMVENILEDCLNDFFRQYILKYREAWKLPIHFTGSVAFGFSDVIEELCHQYELDLGKIEKSPLEGLMTYHQSAVVA